MQPRAQDGFLLLEVLVSALIVALIAIATLTGLNSLTRSSSEQRQRNEAALLASQSQQQLRSDPASTLLAFPNSQNSYETTVAGTKYTVVQKATFGNGSSQTGCSATETTKGQGTYILNSTSVTWNHMAGPPLTQSSLITPPTGSAIDIEVSNGEIATSGVTVLLTYVPSGSSSTSTLEGTTGSGGCVLFAGIPSTAATVEIKQTNGIVNKFGTLTYAPQNFTLAPNILTHDPVKLALGGAITANFAYEGKSTYSHKNNAGTVTLEEHVTGDTFVAFNVEMEEAPTFEKGNTIVPTPYSGSLFEVAPGVPGRYAESAKSPTETIKYPRGNLFPFPEGKPWTAYAGDCTANKPETFDAAITSPTEVLKPAQNAALSVPMTYLSLNVYSKSQAEIKTLKAKGTATWPSLETTNGWLVTITNRKCAGVTPNNEKPIVDTHTQYTTQGSEWGGHLSAPFQPFGEYELCLTTGAKSYKFHEPYTNKNPTKPVSLNVYLNELTQTEIEAARTSHETEVRKAREATEKAAKEAREGTEKTARTAREASEATTRTKREATEATNRVAREKEETTEKETKIKEEATKSTRVAKEAAEKATWLEEEKKGKITKSGREAKEATQTSNRKTAEATEKTAREKRETEEKATEKLRKEEESAKKTAETKELETKVAAEAKEAEAKSAAEAKETPAREAEIAKEATAKTEAIKAEATELKEKENVVEAGNTC